MTRLTDERLAEMLAEWEGNDLAIALTELVAARKIIDEIATLDFFDLTYEANGRRYCRFCDAEAYVAWDEDGGGNRFADAEFSEIPHAADCLVVRARALTIDAPR